MNRRPFVFGSIYGLTLGLFPAQSRCVFQRFLPGIRVSWHLRGRPVAPQSGFQFLRIDCQCPRKAGIT
jgi:hypothetical protein